MHQVLTIAWREITRLRKRFGGASPLAVLLMLGVLGLAAFALRNGATLGNGLYRVGISGEVPPIRDGRFTVVKVDPSQGQALLDRHAIDVFMDGPQVYARSDDKSLFALTALKQILEKQELQRVGSSYSYDLAFPVRVGIHYLGAGPAAPGAAAPATSPEETIIPSLTPPPAPFTQVIIALLYILPITFTSIFFTSSFMDEKVNRRLVILLSAPVTPFQIILGKMLPYGLFALASTVVIAVLTHASVLLALAIYAPTTLFIFAIYLMVPLFYRSFKDTTFIAMLVTTLTTAYLVFPAMFTNISELAYMSPLTLAVKMYRGEPFGSREYLLPSLPMAAIFGLAMFAGARMLNEEFLMGYRPLTRKLTDAIYLMLKHARPTVSVPLMSLFVIPVVYLVQLVFLAIATNLPLGAMLGSTLVAAALVEEIAKSLGIVVLADHGWLGSTRGLLLLALLSALGFLAGEKLLLLVSINTVSQASISGALFSTGGLLLVPLIAHFVFTAVVLLLHTRVKFSYALALAAGTILHASYNWYLVGGLPMNAFLAVIKKELNSVLRDRTMVIAIVLQLFIASFSSALLLGLLALYDPDTVMQYSGSSVHVGLVSAAGDPLQTFLEARGVPSSRYATLASAKAAFYRRDLNAILVAPPEAGGLVQVQLYLSDNDFAPIIRTVLQSPLKQYENYQRARRSVLVRYTNISGKPATAFEFIYSVLLPMLMFFPAFVAGSMAIDAITEEVENNTLPTLLSAPLSLNGIVNAKISAAVLLAVVQCTAWLGLLWLNHIAVQNPAWVLGLAVIVAGVTATGAALVAVLFRDRERAQFVYSLALLAAVAISTLLGLSPVETISRLAIGDYYTGGWNVALVAGFLALLWLLLSRLAHRLAE